MCTCTGVYVFDGCLLTDKKRSKPDSVDCTPPDFIMPNSKERPLLPLHPGLKDLKVGPQFRGKKWVLSYHRIKFSGYSVQQECLLAMLEKYLETL